MKHLLFFLSILLTFNACVEKQSTQDDAQQLDMSSPDMQSTDQGTSQGGMEATLGGETAGELAGEPAGEQAGEVQAGETAGENIPTPPRYRELIQEATGELIGEEGAVGAAVILVTAEHTEVLGLGLREIDGAPVDAQTVFQIGSVSKPITGLILASLIEAPNALIRADDPVNDHLSDLSVPSGQDGPITLEQLATHYSALPNFPNNLIGPNTSPGQGYTRELLNNFLSGHTLDNEPGTSYIYSNLGYGLLGLSLSDALNTSDYEQLLLDEFIKPLSLERTGLKRSAFLDQIGDNISEGYGGANGRTEVGIAEMGVLASSGEILTTAEDMAKFLRVMCGLDSYPVEGAIDRALAPRAAGEGMLKIAYGWDVNDAEPQTWSKTGLTPGFTSFFALRQNPQIGVAIISNRGRHRTVQNAVRTIISRLTLD